MKHQNSFIVRSIFPVLLAVLTITLVSCGIPLTSSVSTIDIIRERGSVILITHNSANSYYIYRDRPMGFEYDLAKEFASYLDVELEVITPGWLQMIDRLESGWGDFIAAGMTITESRQERVDFSDSYLDVKQQIILKNDNRNIRDIGDLNGRTVHVRAGTSYHERLEELIETGVDLKIVLHTDVPTEELIEKVSKGEIEVTVADSNIALLNRQYYPDIKISFPISGEQSLGWAVRKGDPAFVEIVNRFFAQIMENGQLERIYNRYYSERGTVGYVDLKAFHNRIVTHLPRYEEIIQSEAEKYDLDWRLLAAMIYQESRFNPFARSHTGVRGLMQVTQMTAREMGIADRMDPEQSIRAGARYMSELYGRFDDIEDDYDRMLFTLGSYNVGYGHVRDAQKIAGRKGYDRTRWSTMERVLPMLRNPKYYLETKYGYARGTEPVRYVKRIMTYYDILRVKSGVS